MAKGPDITRAAKILGHKGGLVGGPARAKKLTKSQREYIARMGARASHGRHGAARPGKGGTHE